MPASQQLPQDPANGKLQAPTGPGRPGYQGSNTHLAPVRKYLALPFRLIDAVSGVILQSCGRIHGNELEGPTLEYLS